MKLLLVSFMAVSSISSFAGDLPKCNISNLSNAQLCMDKVASKHVEYNLANVGSVSTQKDLLKKVLKAIGRSSSKVYEVMEQTIEQADYVGVMLEKGDEWYLYYYTLKKGKQTQVVAIDNINLVDLNYDLVSPIVLNDLILGDRNKKFDVADRKWIQEYLDLE